MAMCARVFGRSSVLVCECVYVYVCEVLVNFGALAPLLLPLWMLVNSAKRVDLMLYAMLYRFFSCFVCVVLCVWFVLVLFVGSFPVG